MIKQFRKTRRTVLCLALGLFFLLLSSVQIFAATIESFIIAPEKANPDAETAKGLDIYYYGESTPHPDFNYSLIPGAKSTMVISTCYWPDNKRWGCPLKIAIFEDKINIKCYPSPDKLSEEFDYITKTKLTLGFGFPNADSKYGDYYDFRDGVSTVVTDMVATFYKELVINGDSTFSMTVTDAEGNKKVTDSFSIILDGRDFSNSSSYTISNIMINGKDATSYVTNAMSNLEKYNFECTLKAPEDKDFREYIFYLDYLPYFSKLMNTDSALTRAFEESRLIDRLFNEEGFLFFEMDDLFIGDVDKLNRETSIEYYYEDDGYIKVNSDGTIPTKVISIFDDEESIDPNTDNYNERILLGERYTTTPNSETTPVEAAASKDKPQNRTWISAAVPILIGIVILIGIYLLIRKRQSDIN